MARQGPPRLLTGIEKEDNTVTTNINNTHATRARKLERLDAMTRISQPGTPMPATTREASSWGDYLSLYDWSHWVTVTPPYPEFTPGELWTEFKDGFIRRLGWKNNGPVTWFAACERSPGGVYHIHALIGCTSTLPTDCIAAAWTRGRVSVAVYDPSGRAAWYASKTAHQEEQGWTRWDMSSKFPPLRPDVPPLSAA